MLIWITLLLLGEGAGDPIGPTPDVGGGFDRRRVGAFVKRGGVGRLRRGRP